MSPFPPVGTIRGGGETAEVDKKVRALFATFG
jgi:hypothetical protein